MTTKVKGVLEVKCCSGRDLIVVQKIGKQDPFLQFEYNATTQRIKADNNGGQKPVWNEAISFNIVEGREKLGIQCYDENLRSHAYIGELVIELKKILEQHTHDAWFPLKNKGSPAGEIYMEFTYFPADGSHKPFDPVKKPTFFAPVPNNLNVKQSPGKPIESFNAPSPDHIANNTNVTKIQQMNPVVTPTSHNPVRNEAVPSLAPQPGLQGKQSKQTFASISPPIKPHPQETSVPSLPPNQLNPNSLPASGSLSQFPPHVHPAMSVEQPTVQQSSQSHPRPPQQQYSPPISTIPSQQSAQPILNRPSQYSPPVPNQATTPCSSPPYGLNLAQPSNHTQPSGGRYGSANGTQHHLPQMPGWSGMLGNMSEGSGGFGSTSMPDAYVGFPTPFPEPTNFRTGIREPSYGGMGGGMGMPMPEEYINEPSPFSIPHPPYAQGGFNSAPMFPTPDNEDRYGKH
ncbi:hypothetical protein K7432_002784 [Basidiobolus ranarum]|uniref:C2 domain-containing protein n=1 Tax=Basidiobolus ranarum TaxID=34480 RepID=A0ABR2W7A1_9FUNG